MNLNFAKHFRMKKEMKIKSDELSLKKRNSLRSNNANRFLDDS